MAPLDETNVPPIPTRTHHHIKQKDARPTSLPVPPSSPTSLLDAAPPSKRGQNVSAASPEVITSLISSLSAIAEPDDSHFEDSRSSVGGAFSGPPSPGMRSPNPAGFVTPPTGSGGFGVEYGSHSQPSIDDLQEASSISLDELGATSPVIRTAPLPSGKSPLTAPKSPRHSRSLSRESSGLRSYVLRGTASRPSSNDGSIHSKNDDAESLGNISIERGSTAPSAPELKKKGSRDSWGKKSARNSKGLLYMSSKERLRAGEAEKSRSSYNSVVRRSSSVHSFAVGDPFLAETAISEEPNAAGIISAPPSPSVDSTRRIPMRDSSLRKTGSSAKRASIRRFIRDNEASLGGDPILEQEEKVRGRDEKRHSSMSSYLTYGKSFLLDDADAPIQTTPATARQIIDGVQVEELRAADLAEDEDGAPFPAVAQGRRRNEHSIEQESRRLSGIALPSPMAETPRSKKTTRMRKRLSGGLTPTPERDPRSMSFDRSPSAMATERPTSSDSVDDSVQTYLRSPRLSQQIRHPQTGRVISFSEVGDPQGSAVFCCVGMGLTRYITAFYDELAQTLKLRLITPDRPGVGGSEPYSDGTATPLSWPDDVYAICQVLKITKFSILAHSAGAIYALATALRMPQHIRGRIHLLAPWIPPSQMSTWGGTQTVPPTNVPTAQRVLRALPTPILKAVNSSFMSATSASITSSLPKEKRKTKRRPPTEGERQLKSTAAQFDKENIQNGYNKDIPPAPTMPDQQVTRPPSRNGAKTPDPASRPLPVSPPREDSKERQQTYDMRLAQAIWTLATTNANPAVDLLVCLERNHAIGFRYVDITRPVVIHHGSRDARVPVDNVVWLGKTMRRCEVRVLEGEGHGLMASAAVMGSVLMEMSKEWEDWIRVTGGGRDKEKERESQRPKRGTVKT